ncbi:MAG: PTS sugar transporter subunit IIA [Syntrophobacterales bacterium]|nr:PTS sugar transporter subunit IIA [Syntrophobacterales bacterium]
MIGVLIITHGNLGNELIKVTKLIRGDMEGALAISVDETKGVENLKNDIIAAIKKLDSGEGVLILTDLFGGTPSNISLSFLEKEKVEVVTGVNLPMMLKVSERKDERGLSEFADFIRNYGKNNIYLASEILGRKVNNK